MTRVLISGVSIAGPALAYWLRRYGFEATVVERAPALREGGQAIDLRGAAREVAERMGLMERIREHHTGVVGMRGVNSRNRRLYEWASHQSGHSGGVIAEIEILRADLARILYEAADDVEYLFGDSISALHEDANGVDVTFASGRSRRFGLVVGADGLHSGVRRLAFGPESEFLRDQGYYKAIFATDTDLDLDGWSSMYAMPGRRRAMLYPVRGGRTRGMFFFTGPLLENRRDVTAQKQLVADVMAGAGWQVPRMLESMWETTDFYLDRESMVEGGPWSRGRVVLVGDSVFGGSFGMGTSMAMVGAYVLAGELAAADGDHRVAFVRYREKLEGYVAVNRKPMPGGLKLFLPNRKITVSLGSVMMKIALAGPWRNVMSGGLEEKAETVTLGNYAEEAKLVDAGREQEDAWR